MELEIGGVYHLNMAKESESACDNCGADTWYVCFMREVVYLGTQDNVHIFKHVHPFLCPGCDKWIIHHKATLNFDVTEEFKLLERK